MNTVRKIEFSGELHIGLQANLGLSYPLKKNLEFVLDLGTTYNNYEVTKAKIKFFEIEGVSRMSKIENTNFDIKHAENKFNHSHIAVNIGLKYLFNKKE